MITKHCLSRAQERTGLNEADANRFIERALARGKTPRCLRSNERVYLEKLEAAHNSSAIYYNRYLFFSRPEGCCRTMYQAPGWFGRRHPYIGKERVRKVKKYMLNYLPQDILKNNHYFAALFTDEKETQYEAGFCE